MFHFTRSDRPRTRLSRIIGTAVATLALGGLLSAGMAIPANAASSSTQAASKTVASSLTIKVVAGSKVVPGAVVKLYESYDDGEYTEQFDEKVANAKGSVKFGGVYKGDEYVVEVTAPDADPAFDAYASGWFGSSLSSKGAAVASDYALAAGSYKLTAGAVSKTVGLSVGGVLDGVLYGADGKPFTSGFNVVAYRQAEEVDENVTSSAYNEFVHESTLYVKASATGVYSMPGLRSGQYVVEFDQSDNTTWATKTFNNKKSTKFDAESGGGWSFDGHTGRMNGYLTEAGTVSGTVTFSPAVANKAELGTVEAYTDRPSRYSDSMSDGDLFASAPIGADGSYSIDGLAANNYALKFVPATSDEDPYFAEWYDDASSRENVKLVSVVAGRDVVADSRLAQGFGLSGVVTDHAGKPMKGVDVEAYDSADGGWEEFYTTTDKNGAYSFENVVPGSYVVDFSSDTLYRYFAADHAGGVRSYSAADHLTYTEGDHTADLQFPEPSVLAVHVTTQKGVAFKSAQVYAVPVVDGHPMTGSYEEGVLYASEVRGKSGYYSFDDLEAGSSYAIAVVASYGTKQDVYPQYVGGATTLAEADLYTAKTGSRSIDVTLAASGGLSGTVTATAGKLGEMSAHLYRYSGSAWEAWDSARVASTGSYAFANLDAGSYTVGFAPATDYDDGPETFAGGAFTPETAQAFFVAPGKPVVFNMKLPAPGKITGVVTDSSGKRLAGIQAVALQLEGTPGNWTGFVQSVSAQTNKNGAFTVSGLRAGSYAMAYVVPVDEDTWVVTGADISDPAMPVYTVAAGKTVSAGTQVALTELPEEGDDPTATGLISGSLDTVVPYVEGSMFLENADGGVYYLAINSDGDFSGAVPPGHYSYTANIWSDASEVRYAEMAGEIDIVSGANTLSLPVTPWAPTQFGQKPTLNTTATDVGTIYTISATWSNPSDVEVEYQWLRNGAVIKGATNNTYTSRGSDLGATLAARVTLYDWWSGTDPVSETATVGTVTKSSALSNVTVPKITASGPAVAGTTLRANTGEWTVPGATYSYEWFRNDTTLVGTSSSYKLAPEDADQSISVVVHATKVGYEDAQATSRTVEVAPTGTLVVVTQPTLVGPIVARVRSLLTISAGEWSVPAKYTYTWLRDGKLIPGATASTYRPIDRDYGYEISAQVTATAVGFTTATVETNGYLVALGAASTAKTKPSISGTLKVGKPLTVKPGKWNHSGLTFGYVWKSNGVAIADATSITFTPTAVQKGTKITVEVTAKRYGFADGTATTSSTHTLK